MDDSTAQPMGRIWKGMKTMLKLIKKEFIFDDPIPVPECHSSTILRLENGNLLAAWFGGVREGDMDTLIWTSLCEDGVWSAPRPVAPELYVQHWNPVLFQQKDGTILLFYKLGAPISDWHTRIVSSTDGGKTWSLPREMVPGDRSGGRGPVKNKALRLSSGRVLAGACLCSPKEKTELIITQVRSPMTRLPQEEILLQNRQGRFLVRA